MIKMVNFGFSTTYWNRITIDSLRYFMILYKLIYSSERNSSL